MVDNASNETKKDSEITLEDEKNEEKKLSARKDETIILLLHDIAAIDMDLELGNS